MARRRPGRSGRGATTAWLRGALRRPGRALVVVATLVLMTVGVVAALVAGDSLERLFVADARALRVVVDVEVASSDNSVFSEGLARSVGVEAGPTAARWAPRLMLPALLEKGDRRDADATGLGVGPEERAYPGLVAVSGSDDVLGL